jgi:hypothetical protein
MLNNTKELYSFLDKLFLAHGFCRKKDTYYFSTDECICFFSIGKSSLGGHYDHVMGCFLKEIMIDKDDFPQYYKSHLKFSLRNLANRNTVKQVFDFENHSYKNDEREKIIKRFIEEKALPFLKDVSTKEGILKAVEKYKDLVHYVKGDLMTHLSITYPSK